MATRLSKIQMGNPVDTEGAEIGVWDGPPVGAVPRGSLGIDKATPGLWLAQDGAGTWTEIVGTFSEFTPLAQSLGATAIYDFNSGGSLADVQGNWPDAVLFGSAFTYVAAPPPTGAYGTYRITSANFTNQGYLISPGANTCDRSHDWSIIWIGFLQPTNQNYFFGRSAVGANDLLWAGVDGSNQMVVYEMPSLTNRATHTANAAGYCVWMATYNFGTTAFTSTRQYIGGAKETISSTMPNNSLATPTINFGTTSNLHIEYHAHLSWFDSVLTQGDFDAFATILGV